MVNTHIHVWMCVHMCVHMYMLVCVQCVTMCIYLLIYLHVKLSYCTCMQCFIIWWQMLNRHTQVRLMGTIIHRVLISVCVGASIRVGLLFEKLIAKDLVRSYLHS